MAGMGGEKDEVGWQARAPASAAHAAAMLLPFISAASPASGNSWRLTAAALGCCCGCCPPVQADIWANTLVQYDALWLRPQRALLSDMLSDLRQSAQAVGLAPSGGRLLEAAGLAGGRAAPKAGGAAGQLGGKKAVGQQQLFGRLPRAACPQPTPSRLAEPYTLHPHAKRLGLPPTPTHTLAPTPPPRPLAALQPRWARWCVR